MRLLFVIGGLFLINGCSLNTEIEPINHTVLVHDNSSKVWLVDKMLIGDKDYTPLRMEFKEIVVFHENNAAYFYVFKDFGKTRGKKMTFLLNEAKKEFALIGLNKDYLFEIIYINRKRIRLKPKNNSYKYELVLIPFPEY